MAFKKGQSGNPAGRPKARPLASTVMREQLSSRLPQVIEVVVQSALAGDMQAARIIVERVLPALKSKAEPTPIDLNPDDALSDQARQVVRAMAYGALPIDEANTALSVSASQAKVIEIDELEKRISKLEGRA